MAAKRKSKGSDGAAAKAAAPSKTAPPPLLSFASEEEARNYLSAVTEKDTYRMVTRPSAKPLKEPAAPPTSAVGVWDATPSVDRQMEVYPQTVRSKATQTRQFVLSNPEHLTEWNALQNQLHPASAPRVALTTYESQFSPSLGSFVLHVSFAELEYQQLI